MECIGKKEKVISVGYKSQCFDECKKQEASMFSFERVTSLDKCAEDGSCRCICELNSKHGNCRHRYNKDYNLYALTNYESKLIIV